MSEIHNAKYWRSRAKEARTKAEQFKDPKAKSLMLEIAKDYEQRAERVARGTKPDEDPDG